MWQLLLFFDFSVVPDYYNNFIIETCQVVRKVLKKKRFTKNNKVLNLK